MINSRVLNSTALTAEKGNTLWVAWSAGRVAYAIAAEPLPEVDGIYSKVSFSDLLFIRSPQFSFLAQEWLEQLCQRFGVESLAQGKT